MRRAVIRSVGAACALLVATAASAQSLAEVAQREADRRKTVQASGKLYTNESLRSETAPPAPAAAPSANPAAPAASTAPDGTAPGSTAGAPVASPPASQTEADWRKRMVSARDELSRSQIFAEALQTRINALSADFVNRDDPAQREVIAAERQRALAELERVRKEIQEQQKAIASIQEEARRAGVPPGWVR